MEERYWMNDKATPPRREEDKMLDDRTQAASTGDQRETPWGTHCLAWGIA